MRSLRLTEAAITTRGLATLTYQSVRDGAVDEQRATGDTQQAMFSGAWSSPAHAPAV
jgi:hypothetical protein